MPVLVALLKRLSVRRPGSDDGAATVEAVLWLPMLFLIFGIIVDTSTIYSNRALVLKVIQDENRSYAVHKYQTLAQIQNAVKARIAPISKTAVVESKIIAQDRIQTTVSMKATEIDAIGMVTQFTNLTVFVWAQHMVEDI